MALARRSPSRSFPRPRQTPYVQRPTGRQRPSARQPPAVAMEVGPEFEPPAQLAAQTHQPYPVAGHPKRPMPPDEANMPPTCDTPVDPPSLRVLKASSHIPSRRPTRPETHSYPTDVLTAFGQRAWTR